MLTKQLLKFLLPYIIVTLIGVGSALGISSLYYNNKITNMEIAYTNEKNKLLDQSNRLLQEEIDKTNQVQKQLNIAKTELQKGLNEYDAETDRLNKLLDDGNLRVSILTRENASLRKNAQNGSTTSRPSSPNEIEITGPVQRDILNLGKEIRRDQEKLDYCWDYSRGLWSLHYGEKAPW